MKKLIFATALAVVALAGAAIAQTVAVPQVTTVNPTADRVQIVPNGSPSARSVYASPAQLGTASYAVIKTPTTDTSDGNGYTSTFANYQAELILLAPATMGYAYTVMAPNPSDGAQACVFSKSAITALWVTANTGQSVSNQATSLSANSRTCMTYSAANLTWYRSQ